MKHSTQSPALLATQEAWSSRRADSIVAPSILSANFARLGEALGMLERAGADWVHVDVMDGHFVPNLTIGPPVVAALAKETQLPLDVHLMISNADVYLEAYAEAGACVLTVHQEACVHLHRTVQRIRALGCKAGVSINPGTPVSALEAILDEVDLVLLMSVNPGFGGQRFIPASMERLRQLRQMIGERPIRLEIDGGITPANSAEVLAAGADTIVAGSAVFGAPDKALAIRALRGEAEAIAACLQQQSGSAASISSVCG